MKTIALIMLLLFSVSVSAEIDQKVFIDTSKLSTAVKAEIKKAMDAQSFDEKLDQYATWAGKGKEIGIAVREGLVAVKDVTIDLSESKLGKTVIWLVVWKVAGADFIRIMIGLLLFIVTTWLVTRSYFTLIARKNPRRLVKKTGWWIFSTKEYVYEEPKSNNNGSPKEFLLPGVVDSWVAGLHWFFLLISTIAIAIIAFA